MKKEEDFGIKLNDTIPKLDKINKFDKEVELNFTGIAFLIIRNDDEIERIRIDNHYKLKEEKDYEIEFINSEGNCYTLQIRIRQSYLFLFLIPIILGLLIGIILSSPIKNNQKLLDNFYDFIDLSVIGVDIESKEEEVVQYDFKVNFNNSVSEEINLQNTKNGNTSAKAIAENKVAPGTNGSFSITISTDNSTVDMKYTVEFEDVTDEKPSNLVFKLRGQDKEFATLQELEKYLTGTIKKGTTAQYIIEWEWQYETEGQDGIDTNEGKILENYKFKINVNGEEVI